MSIHNYFNIRLGEGSKANVHFFQNSEMTDIYYFSKIVILLPFYLYAFGGREGVCKKSVFCTLVKMMDDPQHLVQVMYFSICMGLNLPVHYMYVMLLLFTIYKTMFTVHIDLSEQNCDVHTCHKYYYLVSTGSHTISNAFWIVLKGCKTQPSGEYFSKSLWFSAPSYNTVIGND